MKERTRMDPEERKAALMAAALKLAAQHGYRNVTRVQLASYCDVSEALVSFHFGTMAQFRRALMRHAIHEGNCAVVLQGIADGNNQARKAPDGLREAALALRA